MLPRRHSIAIRLGRRVKASLENEWQRKGSAISGKSRHRYSLSVAGPQSCKERPSTGMRDQGGASRAQIIKTLFAIRKS